MININDKFMYLIINNKLSLSQCAIREDETDIRNR